MGINTLHKNELANQRKLTSDAKKLDDRVSIPESRKNGVQSACYLKSRNLRDMIELNNIISSDDDLKYFDELMND